MTRSPGVLRAAAVAVAVICAGCTHDVAGQAVARVPVVKVLPSEGEISDAVGNRLNTFGFAPFVGGREIMPDGFRDDAEATPIRCAGVTETMLRITYNAADVDEAARQSYFDLNTGVDVSGADAAAVRFGSADAARDLFTRFVRDWSSCDGQTVVKHLTGTSGADVFAAISDVAADGAVLSANVVGRQGNRPQSHYARAVALQNATIVEVSLALTAEKAAASRTDDAVRVARVMLAKVGS